MNRWVRILLTCVLLVIVFAGLSIYSTNRRIKSLAKNEPSVQAVLEQIGISQPGWRTLVVFSSREVEIPAPVLFSAWSRLEEWPQWSQPLHIATRWLGPAGWKPGAQFEQTLNLGSPMGQVISKEKVVAVVRGRSVIWSKEENGIKSCHLWVFDRLMSGQTRIIDVEAFQGVKIGLLRPLLENRWKRMFDAGLEGLIRYATQSMSFR
jgi:hypothetical protein